MTRVERGRRRLGRHLPAGGQLHLRLGVQLRFRRQPAGGGIGVGGVDELVASLTTLGKGFEQEQHRPRARWRGRSAGRVAGERGDCLVRVGLGGGEPGEERLDHGALAEEPRADAGDHRRHSDLDETTRDERRVAGEDGVVDREISREERGERRGDR